MSIIISKSLQGPKLRTNRDGGKRRTGAGWQPGTVIHHRERERDYLVMPDGSWRRVQVTLQEANDVR